MTKTNLIARLTHARGRDAVLDEFAAVILDLLSDAILTRAVHYTEVLIPLHEVSRSAGRDIVEAAIQAADLEVEEITWREEPADALA